MIHRAISHLIFRAHARLLVSPPTHVDVRAHARKSILNRSGNQNPCVGFPRLWTDREECVPTERVLCGPTTGRTCIGSIGGGCIGGGIAAGGSTGGPTGGPAIGAGGGAAGGGAPVPAGVVPIALVWASVSAGLFEGRIAPGGGIIGMFTHLFDCGVRMWVRTESTQPFAPDH